MDDLQDNMIIENDDSWVAFIHYPIQPNFRRRCGLTSFFKGYYQFKYNKEGSCSFLTSFYLKAF